MNVTERNKLMDRQTYVSYICYIHVYIERLIGRYVNR